MNVSERRRKSRARRRVRVRRDVVGTDARPRLSVFRSNKYLYLQLVSDESGRTVAAVSTLKGGSGANLEAAKALGSQMAEKCKSLSINEVVFDRNGYQYHGRIKAIADAVRESGIKL